MTADEQFMRRCFELARRGLGHTGANPVVGAVLVHEGCVIGEGWHRRWGGPHAEVECLESVPDADRSLISVSTMYVSLEPCAHWGKQPPCAQRIVEAGIRKVVVSVDDPNPQVAGRGYSVLEGAGVEVVRGTLSEEGRWTARRFLSLHEDGRPYAILKWAQSADGLLAPYKGQRVMLSGLISQRTVHKWRTEEGAILVGYRTALQDNPRLTARLWEGPQPLRIVLDRTGALPADRTLFDASAPTWHVTESAAVMQSGRVQQIELPFDDDLFAGLLQRLRLAGISSLIIEGGRATLDAVIRARLWDEARVFSTPVVLGDGLPAPQLTGAQPAFQSSAGDDLLSIFTRHGSRYSYPAGAAL